MESYGEAAERTGEDGDGTEAEGEAGTGSLRFERDDDIDVNGDDDIDVNDQKSEWETANLSHTKMSR
jgi:hypothetical protein